MNVSGKITMNDGVVDHLGRCGTSSPIHAITHEIA